MRGTAEALRQVPYFAEMDAALIKDLAGQVRERTYKAGEVILLEGDACEGLYFVASGRVKVFKVSGEGKEQVLRILGPGRTFNDVPVFDGGPNPGSIATMEPSTIGFLPKALVLTLVEGAGGACARLTQHQIAAMTGSVREVVQRALKALEKDGAIRLGRARVAVLDVKALEHWSEPTGSPAS